MSIRCIESHALFQALAGCSRAAWQEPGTDTRGMQGEVEKGDG